MARKQFMTNLDLKQNKIIMNDEQFPDAQWEISVSGGEIKISPANDSAKKVQRNNKIDSLIDETENKLWTLK